MKSVHDAPEVKEGFSLWQRVKARFTENLRKLDVFQNSPALDRKANRRNKAEALLDGKTIVDDAAERRETLGALQQERAVLPTAIAIAKGRYDSSVEKAGAAILDEAGPMLEEKAQALASAAVTFSERVEEFLETYVLIEDAGASPTSRYPGLNLSDFRASDPFNAISRMLDALTNDFGVTVSRDVLLAAEKERERVHLAEQKEKQHSGHARYAGPRGSGLFLKGGERKPNPHEPGVLIVPPPMVPGNPSVAR